MALIKHQPPIRQDMQSERAHEGDVELQQGVLAQVQHVLKLRFCGQLFQFAHIFVGHDSASAATSRRGCGGRHDILVVQAMIGGGKEERR